MLEPLDVVFLSYKESNADENWKELIGRFPFAKRVSGVKGIREAHQEASRLSNSEFFFVVDADNKLRPEFNFEAPTDQLKPDTLYVWRCLNPVNGLRYGYGAIKLYNKSLLRQRSQTGFLDLATSTAERYQIVPVLASETHFFSNPKEAWQGAFRECVKLASEAIRGQKSNETQNRLMTWCEVAYDVPNRDWVLRGAREGREFAISRGTARALEQINDFDWLNNEFQTRIAEVQARV